MRKSLASIRSAFFCPLPATFLKMGIPPSLVAEAETAKAEFERIRTA